MLETLEKEMREAAAAMDFEKAMELRDIYFELKRNLKKYCTIYNTFYFLKFKDIILGINIIQPTTAAKNALTKTAPAAISLAYLA